MKKEVYRLVFGCSLSLIVGAALAQQNSHGSSGGSSSSGGSHSTGGNAGGGSSSHSGSGSNYSGGNRSGGTSGSSGYTSRYGQSNNTSRYQSRYSQDSGNHSGSASSSSSHNGSSSGSHSSGSTGSRYSGGSGSTSRYSNSYSGRSGSSESRSSSGGYGRGTSASDSQFSQGHANLSRSGSVSYSGNNNLNGVGHVVGDERFSAAPHGLIGPSTLGHVIGNNNVGLVRGGYRVGYFGYFGGWRDSFFAFPFYVFDPFLWPCYVSPWYYYPCLPAYVAAPNVIIVDSYPSANWSGSDYDWSASSQNSSNPILDDSIQDVVEAFENDDHKAIDRVVPHSGNVNIYVDGKYSYSLKANDFYDTYVDGIESTKSDRYEILEVKANANGTARVTAKHVYNDPWGNRTYVYHSYFLVKEGDEYVIREFGTSDYRTGW